MTTAQGTVNTEKVRSAIKSVGSASQATLALIPKVASRPVNIGNPVEMSVREIAEIVIEISGSESELVFEPFPQDDPKRRCPDIRRAREVLGWEPRVMVREGLDKTLSWFAGREIVREVC
jgi:nucleoside-diphosphate-sugar epimerase